MSLGRRRQEDLILNDGIEYDKKVADYIKLFQKTKHIALQSIKGQDEKKAFQTDLDKFLTNQYTKSNLISFWTMQAI